MTDQPPPQEGGPTGPPPHSGADPVSPRPGEPEHQPATGAEAEGRDVAVPEQPERGPEHPAPTGPTVVDEGFLETALGVITDPVATLRAVTQRPKVNWAVWLTLGIGLLTGIAGLADIGADPATDEFLQEFPEFAEFADFPDVFGPVMVVVSPFLSLLWITIVAAVLQGTASLLGGDGRFRGMFVGVAFANIPNVFGVITPVLAVALGTAGTVLGGLISFGLFVWVVILGAIAVRENHGLSTGRAAAAVLIPFLAIFLLVILLVILVVVFFFAALGG